MLECNSGHGRGTINLHVLGMQSSPELSTKLADSYFSRLPVMSVGSHLHDRPYADIVDGFSEQSVEPPLIATKVMKSLHEVAISRCSALAGHCIHCTHAAIDGRQQDPGKTKLSALTPLADRIDVEAQDPSAKPKQSRIMGRFRKIWPLAGVTVGLASLGLHIAELVAALN
ncbi:hypothetical protein LTR95_002068 [Oleoguttula sp. CCFEE 5521]